MSGVGRVLRTARAVAGLGLLLGTAACSSGEHDCPTSGGGGSLVVSVDPEVRSLLASLDVDLCQGDRCEHVGFAANPPNGSTVYVHRDIPLDGDTYLVGLQTLGRGWKADVRARLRVEGRSARGRVVVRRTESFVFQQDHPDGKGCGSYLTHRTRVG